MLRKILRAQAAVLAAALLLAGGCSVSQPAPAARRTPDGSGAGASQTSSKVAEINKAISAASQQSAGSSKDYRLGPNDLLQVTIYNIPEQESRVTPRLMTVRVSQDGKVVLPLIGELEVRGKTSAELERDLGQRFAKFIRNPQIGVLITEFHQRVSVMGAVQKPGVFDLTGPQSVVDALALAGGVTDKAGNQVHVYRQDASGARQSIVIDLAMLASSSVQPGQNGAPINMPLHPGDVINVPQSGMFFVDGAVKKPGSYPLSRNYTLTQALATAGGVDPELADYSEITINRRLNPEKVEVIPVDLNNVNAGKAADPQLQPDDVILVPMSGFKYFVKRFVGTIFSGASAPSIGGY